MAVAAATEEAMGAAAAGVTAAGAVPIVDGVTKMVLNQHIHPDRDLLPGPSCFYPFA